MRSIVESPDITSSGGQTLVARCGNLLVKGKSQSNRIYAGELSGAEVETCWQQENIAGTETGRKQIS
jgi:hypothetical protein